MLTSSASRDGEVRACLATLTTPLGDPRSYQTRLSAFIATVWPVLQADGVSWVGFYLLASDGESMLLEAREPGPACSPIGMHGACGQSARSASALVVVDVEALGRGYIACDPRDRSELVVPIGSRTEVKGVLDLDSHQPGRFCVRDVDLCAGWLEAAGIHVPVPLRSLEIGGLPPAAP